MSDPIRLLLVDDESADRELAVRALKNGLKNVLIREASNRTTFLEELNDAEFDAIITDYALRGLDGLEVIDFVQQRSPQTPVILLTATGTEEVAVEAMRRGVADYVIKTVEHIRRLPSTVEHVLERVESDRRRVLAEEALCQSEEKYRILVEQASDGIFISDADGNFLDVNTSGCLLVGYTLEELRGLNITDLLPEQDLVESPLRIKEVSKGYSVLAERRLLRKDGSLVPIEVSTKMIADGRIHSIVRDVSVRKKSEEALRASHEKYQNLFNNAQVGLFRTRISDGKVVECNDLFANICGYDTREECIADCVSSENYFDPESRDRFLKLLEENGEVYNYEAEFHRRDGARIWFAFSARVFPEDGCLEGACIDITDHRKAEHALREARDELELRVKKRTEELSSTNEYLKNEIAQRMRIELALRESEGRFRAIAEAMPAPVLISRISDGTIYYGNPAFSVMFGIPKDQLQVERTPNLYADPRVRDQMMALLEKEGSVRDFEIDAKKLDGTRFWVSVSVEPITFQEEAAIFTAFYDITERRQAEEALRESEKRFRVIAEATPIPLAITCLSDGRILFSNLAACDAFGLARDEVVGRRTHEFYANPDDRRKLMDAFAANGRLSDYEVEVKRVDNSTFWVSVSIEPITFQGDKALFTAYLDVTERKSTEEALRRAERLASIGTFAAGVAHEINNPLGAILLYAQTGLKSMKKKSEKISKAHDCLREIKSETERCARIVKGVLQFARQEESRKESRDLLAIISRARDLTRRDARQRDVSIQIDTDGAAHPVRVNHTQIEQVFVNLFNNAVEASEPGMPVTVSLEADNGFVRVRVQDRGCGMTEEEKSRVFDPFYSTHPEEGGTGLGLSIAHGIVLQHGGEIEIQTAPGEGTQIFVTLPAAVGDED